MEVDNEKPNPVQILDEIGTSMHGISVKVVIDPRFLGPVRLSNGFLSIYHYDSLVRVNYFSDYDNQSFCMLLFKNSMGEVTSISVGEGIYPTSFLYYVKNLETQDFELPLRDALESSYASTVMNSLDGFISISKSLREIGEI